MVRTMQGNYRGRLFRLFAVNVPFMLRALWKVISMLVDSFTYEKMYMRGVSYPELLDYIAADKLESKYGGNLKEIEGTFFPPDLS